MMAGLLFFCRIIMHPSSDFFLLSHSVVVGIVYSQTRCECVADLAEQYGVITKAIYGWLRQASGECVVSVL